MSLIFTTSITNKNSLYPNIQSVLGQSWIEDSIINFFNKRNGLSERNPYNSAIQNLEKSTHPLIRDIVSQIDTSKQSFDLSDLPECKARYELILLDRDLGILQASLEQVPETLSDYKNELVLTDNYDQRRFELFTAANYILAGFNVTFLARKSTQATRTNEFNVRGASGVTYQIECKQRYQREPDSKREKFLFLLTEKLFPVILSSGKPNVIIELDWQGEVNYGDVDKVQKLIVEEFEKGAPLLQVTILDKYKLTIKKYTPPLPKELTALERNIPHYVTTQDCYLAVDKGIYLSINRDFNQNTMSKIRSLYQDAKGQFENSLNSIIFIDVGTLPPEIIDEFTEYLKRNPPRDVGALIVLKHQLHINGDRKIIFTPYPQVFWNKKLLPSQTDVFSMPGSIGETGFDNYLEVLKAYG